VSGVLESLPGCNPVTLKPVTISDCPRNPSRILSIGEASGIADLTAQGWEYIGCGIDDPQAFGSRALTGAQKNISPMTIAQCVQECSSSGFSHAGLEFGSEYVFPFTRYQFGNSQAYKNLRCYCGSTLDSRAAPRAGILGNCNMKCTGDSTQNCGGSKAISLYQKCAAGATCENAGSGTSSNSNDTTTPIVQPPPADAISTSSSATVVPYTNSTATPIVQPPPADAISTSSSSFLGPYANSTATGTSISSMSTISSISNINSLTPAGPSPTSLSSVVNIAPSEPGTTATTAASSRSQTTLATVTKAPSPHSRHIPSFHSRTITTTFVEYWWG
jgi:hypothetical protein